MSRTKLSRRQFVAATALTSAAMITAPYVRGAYAAGKLSIDMVPSHGASAVRKCGNAGTAALSRRNITISVSRSAAVESVAVPASRNEDASRSNVESGGR